MPHPIRVAPPRASDPSHGEARLRIAVVGSGVAGLGAARVLAAQHHVEVFEAAPQLGGHVHTVPVPSRGRELAIDMGFIVFNVHTYPRLTRLFDTLEVETRPTVMSFSNRCDRCRFEWGSNGPRAWFSQKNSVLRPARWKLLLDIRKYLSSARQDAGMPFTKDLTLGEYLAMREVSPEAVRHFVLPMGASLWSTDPARMLGFPASTFLQFFSNHGMLGVTTKLPWRTVTGGSNTYIQQWNRHTPVAAIHTSTPVTRIARAAGGATLYTKENGAQTFDRVVLAVHSDTALSLLHDPTAAERRVLAAIPYTSSEIYLHTDESVAPVSRGAWSSWNHVTRDCHSPAPAVEASYWMNALQGLPGPDNYFVTLNPIQPIREDRILQHKTFAHPLFTHKAPAAQEAVASIQGTLHTYYAGAWQGFGFHEDGLRSGELAAGALLDHLQTAVR